MHLDPVSTSGRSALAVVVTLLSAAGCDALSPPRPPPKAIDILRACEASAVRAYTEGRSDFGSAEDAARLACALAGRLDEMSFLATSAATVCAHALDAYAPPYPRSVAAAAVEPRSAAGMSGVAVCAQAGGSCGYAFFVLQRDAHVSSLELLGPGGCSSSPDRARGALFACCTRPASPLPPPGPGGGGTTPVPR